VTAKSILVPGPRPWGGWVPGEARRAGEAVGPVEVVSGDLYVHRGDLGYWPRAWPGGARSLKARSCLSLVGRHQTRPGGLVTGCSRHSPQSEIVAAVGRLLGLPVAVVVPSGPRSDHLVSAERLGAEIMTVGVGWNSVIEATARRTAEGRGWLEVPFGMVSREALPVARAAGRGCPVGARTVVAAAGSGVSLAGYSLGLQDMGHPARCVGVAVGRDPTNLVREWGAPGAITLAAASGKGYSFPEDGDQVSIGGVLPGWPLHGHYEVKAWRWLDGAWERVEKPVLFLVVGSTSAATT